MKIKKMNLKIIKIINYFILEMKNTNFICLYF